MEDKIKSARQKIKDENRGDMDPIPSLEKIKGKAGEREENRKFPLIDGSENLKFINENADFQSDEIVREFRKGSFAKRCLAPIIQPISRAILIPWTAFAAHLVRFLNEVSGYLNRHEHKIKEFYDRIDENNQHLLDRMDLLYNKNEENILSLERDIARLEKEVHVCTEQLNAFKATHSVQGRKVKELLASLSAVQKRGKRLAPDTARAYLKELESQEYYGFENLFREKTEILLAKFKAHVPFFDACTHVLDLGCGRGEFLALMAEKGIQAYGVDSNAEMVTECRKRGLKAEEQDILDHLRSLKQGAVDGMFAAQLVEHLPLAAVREFMELAFDRLAPGGKLLVETINPESVYALSRTFYLDYTHIRPMHPEGLKFLLESIGFTRAEIRLLSPLPEDIQLRKLPLDRVKDKEELSFISTYNKNIDRLNSLLYNYQEYAVLVQKNG